VRVARTSQRPPGSNRQRRASATRTRTPQKAHISPPPVELEIPPGYLLTVANGGEAAFAFTRASTDLPQVFERYPTLILTKFVTALEWLAAVQERPDLAELFQRSRDDLVMVQSALRSAAADEAAELLKRAGLALVESEGEVRFNLYIAAAAFGEAAHLFATGDPRAGQCLSNEANARRELADFGVAVARNLDTALDLLDRAEAFLRSYPRDLASCLGNHAIVHVRLGEYGSEPGTNFRKAIELCVRAATIWNDGAEQQATWMITEGIARAALARLGVQPKAGMEEAISLFEASTAYCTPVSRIRGAAELNAANARVSLAEMEIDRERNLADAVRGYERAREAFGQEPIDLGQCWAAESIALIRQAETASNPSLDLQSAVSAARRAAGLLTRSPITQAGCLMNEAHAHRRLVDIRASTDGYARSLELYGQARRLLEPDTYLFAQLLASEAIVYRSLSYTADSQNNSHEAVVRFRQAARWFDRFGASRDAMVVCNNWGWLLVNYKSYLAARRVFLRGIRALERVRSTNALVSERRHWMETNIQLFKGIVECCLRLGDQLSALRYVERGRNRVLEELLPARRRTAGDSERQRRLRRQADELEMMLAREGISFTSVQMQHLGRQRPALADVLRRYDAGDSTAIAAKAAGLMKELSQTKYLTPGSRYRGPSARQLTDLARRLDRAIVILWSGPEDGNCFVFTPAGKTDCIRMPNLGDDDLTDFLFGSSAKSGSSVTWMTKYAAFRQKRLSLRDWKATIDIGLAELYRRLRPAHEWLRQVGCHRVVFVTAGPLALLPMHAASWRDSGGVRYLSDELDITYAPSLSVLARSRAKPRRMFPALVVADPRRSDSRSLAFARWEADQITQVLGAMGNDRIEVLARERATTRRVIRALHHARLAHFACHGQWNFERPLESSLFMAGSNRLTLGNVLGSVDSETDLVVLSACETGIGYRPGTLGEEYLGLPAGFFVAGARSAVSSLWKVEDAATALLMKHFYEQLSRGKEVSAALSAAQSWLRHLVGGDALSLIQQNRNGRTISAKTAEAFRQWLATSGERPFEHAFYWAAFQCFG
jgi:CHAT domain-containing protein